MIANSNITLYNAYYDKSEECTKYKKTYITDVNWQDEQKVTVGDKGIKSADVISIFIPFMANSQDKNYIKPKAYKQLDSMDTVFTFQAQDRIVKGLIDFEVDGSSGHTIKDLENKYDDVVTILSIITEDYGNINMNHWNVGCQ